MAPDRRSSFRRPLLKGAYGVASGPAAREGAQSALDVMVFPGAGVLSSTALGLFGRPGSYRTGQEPGFAGSCLPCPRSHAESLEAERAKALFLHCAIVVPHLAIAAPPPCGSTTPRARARARRPTDCRQHQPLRPPRLDV
jgi:hypothetical protein